MNQKKQQLMWTFFEPEPILMNLQLTNLKQLIKHSNWPGERILLDSFPDGIFSQVLFHDVLLILSRFGFTASPDGFAVNFCSRHYSYRLRNCSPNQSTVSTTDSTCFLWTRFVYQSLCLFQLNSLSNRCWAIQWINTRNKV